MVIDPDLILRVSLLASNILSISVAILSVFLIIQKLAFRRWEDYKRSRQSHLEKRVEGYLQDENSKDRLALEVLGWTDRIILRSLLMEKSESAAGIVQRRIEQLYDLSGLAGEDLQTMVRSTMWWHRAAAAHRLGQIGLKRAKGHLLRALKDSHTEVRLEATWSLGHMKMADSLPLIMQSMAHYFKIAALRMDDFIFQIGDPALPVLFDLCRNSEAEIQLLAIHLVGEFKNSQALPVILPLLSKGSNEIRLAACKAVGTIGDPDGLKELIPCLQDPLWAMRAQAAKQLGRTKVQDAIPELILGLEDQQWWVRYNSGEALAAIGKLGKDALTRALQSKDRFARDMAAQWLDEIEAAHP